MQSVGIPCVFTSLTLTFTHICLRLFHHNRTPGLVLLHLNNICCFFFLYHTVRQQEQCQSAKTDLCQCLWMVWLSSQYAAVLKANFSPFLLGVRFSQLHSSGPLSPWRSPQKAFRGDCRQVRSQSDTLDYGQDVICHCITKTSKGFLDASTVNPRGVLTSVELSDYRAVSRSSWSAGPVKMVGFPAFVYSK